MPGIVLQGLSVAASLSQFRRQRYSRVLSPEHKAKLIAANIARRGRKLTEETKRKIGKANRGRKYPNRPPISEMTREKMRDARLKWWRAKKALQNPVQRESRLTGKCREPRLDAPAAF